MHALYNPNRKRVSLDTGPEVMTKQAHKDECDIYNILAQFKRTGIVHHINSKQPIFADLPSNLDYQTAMNDLIQAQNAFAALPAAVRDHFRNDPQRFLAAFKDASQAETLRGLGLLNPKPPADSPPAGASGKPADGAS